MRDPLESKYLAGHHYGLNDFDKHMCLQPGLVIWLVIAFLMRPYIVMVMSFAQMGNRMGTIDLVYPDRIWFAVDALAALPAVLVVVVSWMRRPGARALVRRAWHNGRAWLLTSSVANASVAVMSLVLSESSRTTIVSPILLVLSVWCLWFLWVSRRVRDVFADFPDDDRAPDP